MLRRHTARALTPFRLDSGITRNVCPVSGNLFILGAICGRFYSNSSPLKGIKLDFAPGKKSSASPLAGLNLQFKLPHVQTKKKEKIWKDSPYDYDCIVIGGGSGGITFAVNAAKYTNRKARILLLDFVKPSHRGSTWGLGGTCTSVGCIPKKLYHHATHALKKVDNVNGSYDFHWEKYGWDIHVNGFDWSKLTQNVQQHIRSLNFKFRGGLMDEDVEYQNAYGRIVAPHQVEVEDGNGNKTLLSADKIIIATGGRPHLPHIPGIEHTITSDDLFSLPNDPGRTLVIGAGYIAMECAGFLNALPMKRNPQDTLGTVKRPVSIMVRSQPLRSFDHQCVGVVVEQMRTEGVQFLEECTPVAIRRIETPGSAAVLEVVYKSNHGKEHTQQFDTVLMAVGRDPQVQNICDPNALNLHLDKHRKKIITNERNESSVEGLYAIGDVVRDGLELTPVAIQAGLYLAQRMFGISQRTVDMNFVPTTIFTPKEYSSIGLSEEQAVKVHGEDNLAVYYKTFNVLENALTDTKETGFMKLITLKNESERVIGFHFVGADAGEISQAVAVAMRLGATKEDFDSTIGIHPTVAEQMTTLKLGITEDTGC